MSTSTSTTSSRGPRWHLPALLVLSVLAMLPGLVGAAFVYDDAVLILDNPALASLEGALSGDLWAGVPGASDIHAYYRPGVLLSFYLDRQLFGLSPLGFRLHSLALHLLNVGLLWALGWRWRLRPAALTVGVALFALHPVQVEAVVFVAARNDLQATSALLGTLLLLSRPESWWARVAGATLLMAWGTLCKESLVLAPVAHLASERARGAGWGRPSGYLAMGLGVGLALALRWGAGVGTPAFELQGVVLGAASGFSRSVLAFFAVAPGASVLLDPVSWVFLGAGAVGVAALLLRRGGWGLLVAATLLAPALGGVAAAGLVADRYLYGPMVGLGLALAMAIEWRGELRVLRSSQPALSGSWRDPWIARPALALFALSLAGVSAWGAWSWRSDTALWQASVKAHPNAYTAGGYAKALEQAGEGARALSWYGLATRGPVLEHACYNVARLALELEGPEGAAKYGDAALAGGCPPSGELLGPSSVGFALLGEWERAEELARMVEVDPTGLTPVVRAAAATRRGESDALTAQAKPGADLAELEQQVQWLLDSSP